jgi:murein DD-endopeptidase MepM/ murein hydrolase activator NlpD
VARPDAKLWLFLVLVPALMIVGGVSVVAWRQTVPAVKAELVPTPRFLGVKTPLTVVLRAAKGGLVSAELRLVQGQGRAILASPAFTGAPAEQRLDLTVEGRATGLREGQAVLEVRARDNYWRLLRVDDRPVLTVPVTLDFTPPTLEVLGNTRYLAQGGGGLVALRARGAARVGVNAGGVFFPAVPAGAEGTGVMVAMLALPWDLPAGATVSVLAQDEAGNSVTRGVPSEIKAKRFPTDTIELKEEFLKLKVAELLPEKANASPAELIPAFLRINRDQRKAADQTKRELAAKSQPRPLWEGAFVQPRNTKVFSNFAETRSYRYEGREVDVQVHLGFDLASSRHSPVPAANSGVVVFAAPLTIYGTTVVVDHGWGLQTLYAHLSSLLVKEGDKVEKGQELGRTGTTGLAVGDHLHYEVLIHGIPVTPLEWWDARWIRDHIGRPLREASLSAVLSGAAPTAEDEQVSVRRRRSPR